MDVAAFILLAKSCAPSIDIRTARALVAVESNFNPYAIGVVGGSLVRQPRTLAEAMATVQALQRDGWSYSVGLGQINDRNFARLGLTPRRAFDECANLKAMDHLLSDCFANASKNTNNTQRAVRFALSCYYSGNFERGFIDGYVSKVERASFMFASVNVDGRRGE